MRRHRRGFRIVDGWLAIAATALGLAWARAYWGVTIASASGWRWWYLPGRPLGESPLYWSTRSAVLLAFSVGSTLASVWGMALVVLRRARRPASPFWRARRPGALACLAASAVLGLLLVARSIGPAPHHWNIQIGPPGEVRSVVTTPFHDAHEAGRDDPLLNAALEMPRVAGLVVGGAWLALAMAGRWRAERWWVDRAGRLIGWFWIASAVHSLLFPLY